MSVPFGIQKGVLKNQIKVGKEHSLFNYRILDVPRPHSYFPYVCAQITPINGVSRITALGDSINAGRYGINLKKTYDELLKQLSNKYGKPKQKNNFDLVMEKTNYYVVVRGKGIIPTGINLNGNPKLSFFAIWKEKKESSLQNDLMSIELTFHALDSNNGFFMLDYYYDNYPLAEEEINNIDETAL